MRMQPGENARARRRTPRRVVELRKPQPDKAWELTAEHLAAVADPVAALALKLIAAFGLRRAEALKFSDFSTGIPAIAIRPAGPGGTMARVCAIWSRAVFPSMPGFDCSLEVMPPAPR